jgi:hypothetical protein
MKEEFWESGCYIKNGIFDSDEVQKIINRIESKQSDSSSYRKNTQVFQYQYEIS